MKYLCRICCKEKGVFFDGDALNETGRKICLICDDNSSTPLHILSDKDLSTLRELDRDEIKGEIIGQSQKEDNAGYGCTFSLRDHFAIQAMNALIIGNGADISALNIGAAMDAYNVADHMLEIRAKTQPKV